MLVLKIHIYKTKYIALQYRKNIKLSFTFIEILANSSKHKKKELKEKYITVPIQIDENDS